MPKKYTIKLCTIIIVLVAALTLSTKGNTQTNNKLKSKGARIKNPTSQQKQIKKTIKPQRQLSNSAKFSTKIKALEKKLSLTKTELAEVKKTDVKKDGEISKLNEDINFLLDSLDDLDAELKVQVGAYEKYKELITCYRTALINWDDLHRRQGLTEQDHFVIRIELRRSLFSCPPMSADNLAIYE